MNFVKFWRLAEKYPWLPRIINSFYPCLNQNDPEIVTRFLGPRALARRVKFIAFRPWEKLNLDDLPSAHSIRQQQCQVDIIASVSTSFACYWHRTGGEFGFQRALYSDAGHGSFKPYLDDSTAEIGEANIRTLLDLVLGRGGVVDGIVIVRSFVLEGRLQTDDLFRNIFSAKDEETHGYNIFLPPKKT